MGRCSHAPSRGKKGSGGSGEDHSCKPLLPPPLSYGGEDKSCWSRYPPMHLYSGFPDRSYILTPEHRNYLRSATGRAPGRRLLPCADQRDCPAYAPASPPSSLKTGHLPAFPHQYYTAGWSHPRIPERRHIEGSGRSLWENRRRQ